MATNQDPVINTIKRFAIDSSGRLGSLYDGYRDCVLGQLRVKNVQQSCEPISSAQYQIIKGVTNKKLNLLRLFRIEEELQLSILLNMTPKIGLASFIDYPRSMNEFTRILHFQYINGKEQVFDNYMTEIQPLISQSNATHIITGVSWGFYVVIIVQLPSEEETAQKLDKTLEKLRITLESESADWVSDDENLFGSIGDIKIHSNVSELTRMTTLYEVCHHIYKFKRNIIMNYPMTYTLRPITHLHSECTTQDIKFNVLPSALIDWIGQKVLQMLCKIQTIDIFLNDTLPKTLGEYLKGQLYDARQQSLSIKEKYNNELDRLSKLLIDYRKNEIAVTKIKEVFHHTNHITLERTINDLIQNLKSLEEKGQLIASLQSFKYCNVVEHDIDKNATNETIERKLIIDEQHDRVLCTNDVINKNNLKQLDQLRFKLLKEREGNSNLRLIYADFSYSSFSLNYMMILPIRKVDDDQNQPEQNELPTTSTDIINILLLGETGVGKSTFINALVNYLTFDSLQIAEKSQPVIVIPVSFLMTVGNNFEEYTVALDNSHKSADEHFNAFGQSVTQHCRSYLLDFKKNNNNNNKQKIRIIDTPGFGDTRGSEQDDRNMQYILEYINNLTHINAICFLFKPNTAKLNMFFRSCITQLLNHLGPKAGKNIIFCFTNTRTTFYTPGDTAPLLKSMLNSLPSHNIPFKKENTFCFDSESFRYLAALQKRVPFDDLNKSEYEQSWLMSTKESKSLINYISKKLSIYQMDSDQQSIKSIQFKITHMIRPILETMRNILRNILLNMLDSPKNSIELRAKSLHRLATECQSCRPIPIQVGKFWILPDLGHEIQDKCLTCSCNVEQHHPIEYMLKYHYSTTKTSNFDQLNSMLLPLFNASVKFGNFLVYATHSTKDDPFLIGFKQMIEVENEISRKVQPNEFNLQLVQQLETVLHDYEERMAKIRHRQWDGNLCEINDQIKIVMEHPIVSNQIAVIKQGREIMTGTFEYVC